MFFKDKGIKRIKRAFSGYIPEEALESITGKNSLHCEFKDGEINYLIMQVRDDRTQEVPTLIAKASEIILSMNGVIVCILSSLLVATFGFPFEKNEDGFAKCEKTANYLLDRLRGDSRVIFGKSKGLYGNLGSSRCAHYGPLVPGMAGRLEALLQLEFGQSRHIESGSMHNSSS
jgi:hypothetical protein